MSVTTLLPLGIRSALRALDESLPMVESHSEERALVAAGTVLFWACALDEQLARMSPEYRSVRNGDRRGELLVGMKLGRNAIAHGVMPVVLPAQGLTGPLTAPLSTAPVSWSTYEVVQAGLSNAPRPYDRSVWEQRMSGRPIAPTLAHAWEWLSESAHQHM